MRSDHSSLAGCRNFAPSPDRKEKLGDKIDLVRGSKWKAVTSDNTKMGYLAKPCQMYQALLRPSSQGSLREAIFRVRRASRIMRAVCNQAMQAISRLRFNQQAAELIKMATKKPETTELAKKANANREC